MNRRIAILAALAFALASVLSGGPSDRSRAPRAPVSAASGSATCCCGVTAPGPGASACDCCCAADPTRPVPSGPCDCAGDDVELPPLLPAPAPEVGSAAVVPPGARTPRFGRTKKGPRRQEVAGLWGAGPPIHVRFCVWLI